MKRLLLPGIALFALLMCFGCLSDNALTPVTPVEESYEYTTVSRVYANPSVVTVERQAEYLPPHP